jgi:hypothetical protein
MRIVSESGLVWKNICFLMSHMTLLTSEAICHLVKNGYSDDEWYIGRDEYGCALHEDAFIYLKGLRNIARPSGYVVA